MRKADIWLGTILLLFASGWCWVVVETIPGSRSEGEPGPQVFPLALGLVLGGLALLLLIGAFLGRKGAGGNGEAVVPATRHEVTITALTMLLFVAYAFLLDKIGFLLATPVVMVLALAGILRLRNWVGILVMAFGFTLACHVIFNVLLQASLPHGTWIRIL